MRQETTGSQPPEKINPLDDPLIIEAARRLVENPDNPAKDAYYASEWEEIVNITIRAQSDRDKAEYSAEHDPLTGLLNKRGFKNYMEGWLEKAQSGDVAVIYIDLDNFKSINDNMGHRNGDAFLKSFAGWMRESIRQDKGRLGDILSHPTGLSRDGGDEFIIGVLLNSGSDREDHPITPKEKLKILCGRLRLSFSEFIEKHPSFEQLGKISISLSAAIWEEDMTLEDLKEIADNEMYKEKEKKKSQLRG
ncbi:MAG: GGDEF domain-containing protein [Candidatus Saccharibacteria bacterium]